MKTLTEEQSTIVNTILSKKSDNEIVAVNSIAGAGKTSTAVAVVEAYKPTNVFYTAFNKAIIEEARTKFPRNVECKTVHALAFKYVKLLKDLKELSYSDIKESIPYEYKKIIINCIGEYFRSSFITVEEYFESVDEDILSTPLSPGIIEKLTVKYISKMEEGTISPTFDFMLKTLHILLATDDISIKYDLVILDECQDTVPVTLEIFKLIRAKKKLLLGDTFQNIYGFLNTVNGFELLSDEIIKLQLTQSFRCSESIAAAIQRYGRKYLSPDFIYRGNPKITDYVQGDTSYLSRTNAVIIQRIYEMNRINKPYSLTRGIGEIFGLPLAIVNAASGRPVYNAKYKFLSDEHKKFINSNTHKTFHSYLLDMFSFDVAIEGAIKTLMNFANKRINIFDVMQKAKKVKPDPSTILTTVHTFKGLETDSVYIEDNLNKMIEEIVDKESFSPEDKEMLNLYYVAISRARVKLDNAVFAR